MNVLRRFHRSSAPATGKPESTFRLHSRTREADSAVRPWMKRSHTDCVRGATRRNEWWHRGPGSSLARAILALLCVPLMMNADAPDQAKDKSSAARLADMSIEQLMNESVTSVSKRETKLADSPAAI